MNVKEEIDKAIGVLKARMDYVLRCEDNAGNSCEERDLLFKAICSLEKWRDSDGTHYIPETVRQMIWFGQQAQLCCKENDYKIIDYATT